MMFKKLFVVTLTIISICGYGLAHAGTQTGGILFSADDIAVLRANPARTASLLKRCDKESTWVAMPVTDFAPPPHYTATGSEVAQISKQFDRDGGVAYRAALCFTISGNRQFAQQSARILSAWGDTLKTVGSKQGESEMNFFVPQYVVAASLIRGQIDWDDSSFRSMLLHLALPASHSQAKNNHANWGVLLESSIAAYLGDRPLLERNRARWQVLMQQQVAQDGSLPMEICRSDTNDYCGGPHKGKNGMSYTHYTLLPTTLAAQVFAVAGLPVWDTSAGAQLGRAYARAANWTLHPDTFPYFAVNKGQLNGLNGTGYFPILQKHYPNEDAASILSSGRVGRGGLELGTVFGEN